jgi:hypothetical protein
MGSMRGGWEWILVHRGTVGVWGEAILNGDGGFCGYYVEEVCGVSMLLPTPYYFFVLRLE